MSEELLRTTAERAIRYLRELPERGVAPEVDAIIGLERFDEPLPEHPSDPERVIALLDEAGSPATMASAGPRFFGFVIGGSHPVAVAAELAGHGVGPERRRLHGLSRGRDARAGGAALAGRALRPAVHDASPAS